MQGSGRLSLNWHKEQWLNRCGEAQGRYPDAKTRPLSVFVPTCLTSMTLTTRQLLNAIGLKGNGVQLLIGLGLNFTKMYFERQSSSSSDVVGGLTIGLPFQVFVVTGFGEHYTT